jgi:hypothetical protein
MDAKYLMIKIYLIKLIINYLILATGCFRNFYDMSICHCRRIGNIFVIVLPKETKK